MKFKFFLSFVIYSFVFVSSSQSQKPKDNTLSQKEKDKGYILLFDGKTMNGWHGFRDQPLASWDVEDGTLHCKGSAANYGAIAADITTNDKYDNFEFSADWKISPKGNSGILYLVSEDSAGSYLTGPEYQIIDDVNFPEKLEDWQHSAANYAMNPAPTAKPNPAGEWNYARIVKKGNHVEHWLNGKKVVEYELYSPDWYKRKSVSKWKNDSAYGKYKSGYITFQNHGSEAWFKNIMIKKL